MPQVVILYYIILYYIRGLTLIVVHALREVSCANYDAKSGDCLVWKYDNQNNIGRGSFDLSACLLVCMQIRSCDFLTRQPDTNTHSYTRTHTHKHTHTHTHTSLSTQPSLHHPHSYPPNPTPLAHNHMHATQSGSHVALMDWSLALFRIPVSKPTLSSNK